MNHRLLGRAVKLDHTMKIVNQEITQHMEHGGTIEGVQYFKDSTFSPYVVLVRNTHGATKEIALAMLVLEEMK